jgi:hypothetical protein
MIGMEFGRAFMSHLLKRGRIIEGSKKAMWNWNTPK